MNMIKAFFFAWARSATQIFDWTASPRCTQKQNKTGFAINYKLIFLAPRSDATSELTFILAFLKYYSLILGE